jgi:hypothetical protein
VCVFITAGPSTKLFACVGGGYWRTCATRDDGDTFGPWSGDLPSNVSIRKAQRRIHEDDTPNPHGAQFRRERDAIASRMLQLEQRLVTCRCAIGPCCRSSRWGEASCGGSAGRRRKKLSKRQLANAARAKHRGTFFEQLMRELDPSTFSRNPRLDFINDPKPLRKQAGTLNLVRRSGGGSQRG